MPERAAAVRTYDAFLLLSFGGPEGMPDVLPFLENVTRGRGVPPERLAEVAEHYRHFGGVSPINRLNRDLIAAIEAEFGAGAIDLPIYWGNRNWHPMVEDTLARMAADGVRRALVLATSAYGGYSACGQYHEDIARARAAVGDSAPHLDKLAPHLDKLRHFFDHPLFVAANVDAVRRAAAEVGGRPRVVFTAHSIPTAMDAAAGVPTEGGHLYTRQLRETAALVAAGAAADGSVEPDWDLVWQSRSGPPQVPWLEPDISDHLDVLAGKGVREVVVSPIGFVSDHLEVVWDLDTEAREHAAELGMSFRRADTAGTDPRFARLVADLVRERIADQPPARLSTLPMMGAAGDGERCAPGCCAAPARPGA